MAGADAPAARRDALHARRAARLLAARARPRPPVPLARDAARDGRLAGRVDRRLQPGPARRRCSPRSPSASSGSSGCRAAPGSGSRCWASWSRAPSRSPRPPTATSPWFDYRAWAEEFGPGEPVAFDWGHSYGPLDWPREGSEVLRVDAQDPSYWKVEDLDEFDGAVWTDVRVPSLRSESEDDLRRGLPAAAAVDRDVPRHRAAARGARGRARRDGAARRGLQPPGARGRGAPAASRPTTASRAATPTRSSRTSRSRRRASSPTRRSGRDGPPPRLACGSPCRCGATPRRSRASRGRPRARRRVEAVVLFPPFDAIVRRAEADRRLHRGAAARSRARRRCGPRTTRRRGALAQAAARRR